MVDFFNIKSPSFWINISYISWRNLWFTPLISPQYAELKQHALLKHYRLLPFSVLKHTVYYLYSSYCEQRIVFKSCYFIKFTLQRNGESIYCNSWLLYNILFLQLLLYAYHIIFTVAPEATERHGRNVYKLLTHVKFSMLDYWGGSYSKVVFTLYYSEPHVWTVGAHTDSDRVRARLERSVYRCY